MRFKTQLQPGVAGAAFISLANRMAKAATATMREAAAIGVREGRANIGAAGFRGRWQSGFQAAVTPKDGSPALDASVRFFHRIGLATVFEEGRDIRGNPLLWIPIINNLPRRNDGRSWTPRLYTARFGARSRLRGRVAGTGSLRSVNVPGHPPMLVGGPGRGIPLFIGVRAVHIRKRFDLRAIVARLRLRLPEIYGRHLKAA